MKRYYIFILSFFPCISLLMLEFSNARVLDVPIFMLGILLLWFFSTMVLLCYTIVYAYHNKKNKVTFIPVIIIVSSVISVFFLPLGDIKRDLQLYLYEGQRYEIIEMIQQDKLIPDNMGNIKLPKGYKKLADSEEVFVYQNDELGTVVGFWFYRGLLNNNYSSVVYSSVGEDMIVECINESYNEGYEITKLKDNWYFVLVKN